jgi:hypothetical protein
MQRNRTSQSTDAQERREKQSHPLKNLTPDQAAEWVEQNVRDLATAKIEIIKLSRAVAALMKEKG